MTPNASARAKRGLALLVHRDRREAALWRNFLKARSTERREQIFTRYQPFAARIARMEYHRRQKSNFDLPDVEQLAFEALLQAIDRFDPENGTPFEGFARLRIKGHIANGLTQMSERGAQASYRRRAERDRLRSLAPTAREAETDDPLSALSALAATLAMGVMLEDGANSELEAIEDEAPLAFESLAYRELQHNLWKQVDALPDREAFVMRHHYSKQVSFKVIAELLGVTSGRVSQIHRQALLRLRAQLAKFR